MELATAVALNLLAFATSNVKSTNVSISIYIICVYVLFHISFIQIKAAEY